MGHVYMKKISPPTSANGASQLKVRLFILTGVGALVTAEDDRSKQFRNMVVCTVHCLINSKLSVDMLMM